MKRKLIENCKRFHIFLSNFHYNAIYTCLFYKNKQILSLKLNKSLYNSTTEKDFGYLDLSRLF